MHSWMAPTISPVIMEAFSEEKTEDSPSPPNGVIEVLEKVIGGNNLIVLGSLLMQKGLK